jgi:hypothetical protein
MGSCSIWIPAKAIVTWLCKNALSHQEWQYLCRASKYADANIIRCFSFSAMYTYSNVLPDLTYVHPTLLPTLILNDLNPIQNQSRLLPLPRYAEGNSVRWAFS